MAVSYNGSRYGLRDRLSDWLGGASRRETKDAPLAVTVDRGLPPATWTDRNAKNYIAEGYRLNSAVYAVTRTIATGFAEPPLYCYTDETLKKAIPNHPVRKLISRPNEYMGEDEFWKYLATYAPTTGNFYGQIVPSQAKIPVRLWPYSDIVMSAVPRGMKWIDHYNYTIDGVNFIQLAPEEILHFKWAVDPLRPWTGIGALHPVAREVDSDNELTRYLKALLQNDAMPRTIISPPPDKPLTKDQQKNIKEEFELRFGGDRYGSVSVIDRQVEINRMALNMQELAFDAIRGVPEARIAAAYGVPAIVAGLNIGLARSTYSNYEEARRAFTEQTLVPLWKAVASEVQQSIVPLLGNDCVVAFDLSQVRALQEGNDKTIQRSILAGTSGFLTVNEVRADLGREPVQGGDELDGVTPPASASSSQSPAGDSANNDESAPEPNATGQSSDDSAFRNAGSGGVVPGGSSGLAGSDTGKELSALVSRKAARIGKRQAEIERKIAARVGSYLAETYDKLASSIESKE